MVDMRQLLVSLFLLSRPTNAGDVLKFAFHVSNIFRRCCASSYFYIVLYDFACGWCTLPSFCPLCVSDIITFRAVSAC